MRTGLAPRIALGAVGVLVAAYGAWLLLSRQDAEQLRSAAVWLVAGVVLHDVVLAPVVVVLGLLVSRVVPPVARAPIAAGAIVLGSVTLLAVPVLGRFGERSDNPSLLDRDYTAGWLVLAAVVLVAVVVATLARARRRRQPPS
ncbi:hypothetical protein [Nocardioides flavescens]|uniref:Uncharacterized protein n=1 Tax=Nocardioides flavescens TaxID=2691959 RepID=A0A6L7F3G2_9ACTN|nr:hypothetical protein [Nocardioides flavescens]MXG91767.1 hypothetical protein [Nocardioides flavescens]